VWHKAMRHAVLVMVVMMPRAASLLRTDGLARLVVPVHLHDLPIRREQRVEVVVGDVHRYLHCKVGRIMQCTGTSCPGTSWHSFTSCECIPYFCLY
jgi:hypothetical protein